LIASNSSAKGAVRIPITSDIVCGVFNQIIKIKVSFEIIWMNETISTSFARKPDLFETRILLY
jgi:hypothetical protein